MLSIKYYTELQHTNLKQEKKNMLNKNNATTMLYFKNNDSLVKLLQIMIVYK